jgi:hypothetical protein
MNTFADAAWRTPPAEGHVQKKRELPEPLVKPTKHPIKFLKQRVALLGTAAIFTYLGVLAVAGLYYTLFEIWPVATEAWHNLVPVSELRHNIRDVGEGLFGGLLAHMLIWNHYKKSVSKKRNWLDKIEIALHIPNVKDNKTLSGWQLLAAVPIVLIYAVPGFLVAEWLVHVINPYVSMSQGTSFWDHLKAVVTENYPQKLIGYGAAFFFGRRPAKGIFDDVQLWFAERRIGTGKECRWYHPPTFKARCNDVRSAGYHGAILQPQSAKAHAVAIIGLVILALLAAEGFYVINYIAH